MIRKLNYLLAPVALTALVLFFIFFKDDYLVQSTSEGRCKAEKYATNIEISGIVEKKYRNKWMNNIETLKINQSGEILRFTFLDNDVSGLFDILNVGDSIVKPKGDLAVLIIRDGKVNQYRLEYNCAGK